MTISPIRIGFLLKTFPRLSETFILNEILGLEKLGWDIQVYSLKRPVDEPAHPGVSQVRSKVKYIPTLLSSYSLLEPMKIILAHLQLLAKYPLRYLAAARKYFWCTQETRLKEFLQAGYLAVSLEREGIHHLHAHFANTPTAVAEIVHWLTRIPYSFTAHAKDIYTSNEGDLARRIESATAVLTCTAFNENHLRTMTSAKASIHLAYHGIDTEKFADSENHSVMKAGGGPPMILSVGRFCEKKGLDDLIRACAILRDSGVLFQCVLIGYGPLEGQLKELRRSLYLEGLISMPGRMAQPDVIAHYRKASVFALPCLVTDSGDRDGIPNVLFEAMAAGVPVVTTKVSGIAELVEQGESGWLVEPRQPEKLAIFLDYVLAHPEEAAELAVNAKRRVLKEFTLEASARSVHEMLLGAVAKGLTKTTQGDAMDSLSRESNA